MSSIVVWQKRRQWRGSDSCNLSAIGDKNAWAGPQRNALLFFSFFFFALWFFSRSSLCLSVSSFLLWGLRVNSSDCPPRPKSRFESPLKFGPWHAPLGQYQSHGLDTKCAEEGRVWDEKSKKSKILRPSLGKVGGVGWFELVVINAKSLLPSSQTLSQFQLLVLALAAPVLQTNALQCSEQCNDQCKMQCIAKADYLKTQGGLYCIVKNRPSWKDLARLADENAEAGSKSKQHQIGCWEISQEIPRNIRNYNEKYINWQMRIQKQGARANSIDWEVGVRQIGCWEMPQKAKRNTRILGALRVPTSSWMPFGPLDSVLRPLRALRPCDPHVGDWIVC